jgi:hypothetical protein
MDRHSFAFKIMTMHSNDKGQRQADIISECAVICGLKKICLNWSHTSHQYDYYLLGLKGTPENLAAFKKSAKELGAVQDFNRL